jgi:hypothetical protein
MVLLATACAAVPVGQSGNDIFSPTIFGTVVDNSTFTSVDLLPAASVNEMRGMSLSHSAAMTSQQMYDAFYSHAGGCDRHENNFQEDLGAVTNPSNSN